MQGCGVEYEGHGCVVDCKLYGLWGMNVKGYVWFIDGKFCGVWAMNIRVMEEL